MQKATFLQKVIVILTTTRPNTAHSTTAGNPTPNVIFSGTSTYAPCHSTSTTRLIANCTSITITLVKKASLLYRAEIKFEYYKHHSSLREQIPEKRMKHFKKHNDVREIFKPYYDMNINKTGKRLYYVLLQPTINIIK